MFETTTIPVPLSVITPLTPPVAAEGGRAGGTTRVLHVINGEYYSGAERVQDLLAMELPRFGFEVGFACLKPDRFPKVRQAKRATMHELPMRGRFDLRCVRKLAHLIRQENYALLHAHTPRSAWVGSLAAEQAGVPLVYHVHSPTARDSTRRLQNFVNARLERWSIRHAARLITVSSSLAQQMHEQGFAAEGITCVPNGVPSLEIPPRQKPIGALTLGMAALFRPRKGVEILLEALAALRSRGLDVRLHAVGPFVTPEYELAVKDLVDRLDIREAVAWTGFVENIAAELEQMDLFVLPSLFGEGLPMVVLEAMAAGLPVVASHVEGVPEAIRHREDGLLVEPGSVSQLAIAIEEIADGSLDYLELSNNARQRHAECFSAQAMAADVANVYREVLSME